MNKPGVHVRRKPVGLIRLEKAGHAWVSMPEEVKQTPNGMKWRFTMYTLLRSIASLTCGVESLMCECEDIDLQMGESAVECLLPMHDA